MCFRIIWKTLEKPSPSDIMPPGALQVDGTAIKINLTMSNIPLAHPPLVWLPPVPDSNSMDGVFDFGHTPLLIAGSTPIDQAALVDFIKVGDIAVYRTPAWYAIHRIVAIRSDALGKYFTFRGDNNAQSDPDRVRPEHIQWVAIGFVY